MAVPAEHWDSPKFQSCFTQPGSAAKSTINLHNSECLLLLKPLNREYPGKSISVSPPKRCSVDAPDCSVVFLGAVINPDFPTAAEHPHSSPSEKNHGWNRCWDHNRVFPFLEPGKNKKSGSWSGSAKEIPAAVLSLSQSSLLWGFLSRLSQRRNCLKSETRE